MNQDNREEWIEQLVSTHGSTVDRWLKKGRTIGEAYAEANREALKMVDQYTQKQNDIARLEARREGRKQIAQKAVDHKDRADFFKPETEVVLVSSLVWLADLNEEASELNKRVKGE